MKVEGIPLNTDMGVETKQLHFGRSQYFLAEYSLYKTGQDFPNIMYFTKFLPGPDQKAPKKAN